MSVAIGNVTMKTRKGGRGVFNRVEQDYVSNIKQGDKEYESIKIKMTVKSDGEGYFEVSTRRGGDAVVKVPVMASEEAVTFNGVGELPCGIHALYFTYRGEGHVDFISFELY